MRRASGPVRFPGPSPTTPLRALVRSLGRILDASDGGRSRPETVSERARQANLDLLVAYPSEVAIVGVEERARAENVVRMNEMHGDATHADHLARRFDPASGDFGPG